MHADERGTHARVRELMREVVLPSVAEHHGRVIKTSGDVIRARTAEGRARAKANGKSLGRPPKLTPHQQREARKRIDAGDTVRVDEALSINVQSSLESAGQPLTWGADPRKHYVTRTTVEARSHLGLEAYHVPDTKHDNPHHGLIWDLVGMFALDPDRYEHTLDALARASTIVLDAV